MANETLSQLYAVQPAAKTAIPNAAGHAVFSNFGMKILVAGGGSGKGLAVHRASKKETTAGAQLGDEGGVLAGAVSVAPGVWVYQLTDDGLALELTAKGTKYYKDEDLN
ncbi:MAG: hypothetical protein GWN84_24450 [Gammaproteobacteria bacterium]|nr:hypothetical protein [Gammaproteobacteria bacterium]NIR85736.1 hypothetical protein [Gammaproteobacteria bacterium]NIR90269.1 hypothetical protein [Gammaproteobacteria bacterium]NIU06870.1 hypothetical protein [Gammaproteobacteria bacterium]NIV53803.1 hypothetical protein [Gammaproteobacteria bacterium]